MTTIDPVRVYKLMRALAGPHFTLLTNTGKEEGSPGRETQIRNAVEKIDRIVRTYVEETHA